jgi:uncharacterized protein YcbX
MLALHLSLDAVETPTTVHLHGRTLGAYDMGSLAAQWFSDWLGRRLRLVRFDPEQAWAAADARARAGAASSPSPADTAMNAFHDSYPLVAASRSTAMAAPSRPR